MSFIVRPYGSPIDFAAMAALAQRFPEEHPHGIDLPYRFSSWAFDDPENAALWLEGADLVGWAAMQSPFWTVDFACAPGKEAEILPLILAWARDRAGKILASPFGRPAWYAEVFPHQAERIAALEVAGFTSQVDLSDDSWTKVWMTRPADLPAPDVKLPQGFTLRPLNGSWEAQAYVAMHQAVFGTRNMTIDWRLRTLRQPQYRPELDLVIETSNGELAAFCIAWLDPSAGEGRPAGQIEPLGVGEGYRKLGLGKAILAEALRRLKGSGAGQVFVETDQTRVEARLLYESAGFRVKQKVLVYGWDLG